MQCFRKWAITKRLKPSSTTYLTWCNGANSTHYVSPLLSEQKQQKLAEKQGPPPELLAFIISKAATCSKCKKEIHRSSLLYNEAEQALCMQCAKFGEFVFLPSGDPKLIRRAKKHSSTYVIVVKFSQSRKRYER